MDPDYYEIHEQIYLDLVAYRYQEELEARIALGWFRLLARITPLTRVRHFARMCPTLRAKVSDTPSRSNGHGQGHTPHIGAVRARITAKGSRSRPISA